MMASVLPARPLCRQVPGVAFSLLLSVTNRWLYPGFLPRSLAKFERHEQGERGQYTNLSIHALMMPPCSCRRKHADGGKVDPSAHEGLDPQATSCQLVYEHHGVDSVSWTC